MNKRTKRLLAMMSAKPKLRKISGLPPLTYTAKEEGTLKNYRICGQTSRNLFDAEIVQGSFNPNTGAFRDATNRIRSNESDFIYLTQGKYTINADGVDDVVYYAYSNADPSTFLYYQSITSWQSLPCTFTIQTPCYFLFGFRVSDNSDIIPSDISNIMLNSGTEPFPYEPYSESVGDLVTSGEHTGEYKVPVTVSNGTDTLTTPIYLPEQIRKVGDKTEYIEYGTQKMYRIGADDLDVTLPALPTVTGTNTLSVGTEVQPSEVEVTGRIRPVPTGGGE